MRQWMVDPRFLCRQHLLGEHCEHHMFVGTINKGTSIQGYIDNNLLEPESLSCRHEELSNEMLRRGMNHKSHLPDIDFSKLNDKQRKSVIDRMGSSKVLMNKCPICRKRQYELEKEVNKIIECV